MESHRIKDGAEVKQFTKRARVGPAKGVLVEKARRDNPRGSDDRRQPSRSRDKSL